MFNSIKYWEKRHLQFKDDSRGVGNLIYSKDENDKIYENTNKNLIFLLKFLIRKRIIKNKKVLDLGCGIGKLSKSFIDLGFDYTGIDVSEEAIKIAQRDNQNGKFYVSSISDYNLMEEFDLIFARTVFIHLVEEHFWTLALKKTKEHLNKNGIFFLIDEISEIENKKCDHVYIRSFKMYKESLNNLNLSFNLRLKEKLLKKKWINNNYHFINFN